jgi:protein involved in polysaccharide export with SLBB domain
MMGVVGLAICVAGTGCNVAPKARPASEAPAAVAQKLTLRPGDKVDLKFFYAPELNDSQTVRPDGMLSLQLVGDVQVAGKTPSELQDALKDAYTAHLKYPNVSVIVREMYQRKVFVAGEVLQPGLVDLPGDMSVLEAIMSRGGFNMTTAEPASVIVMRYENGERHGYKVDLKSAMQGGTEMAFQLQPQDIVYVPRTAVVNVNQFLEQYVRNMVPQTGFVYTTTVGDHGTLGLDTSRR